MHRLSSDRKEKIRGKQPTPQHHGFQNDHQRHQPTNGPGGLEGPNGVRPDRKNHPATSRNHRNFLPELSCTTRHTLEEPVLQTKMAFALPKQKIVTPKI